MWYTEVQWELLLTAQAGAPNTSFAGGRHSHVKMQSGDVPPAWVQHPPPVLLPPGLCWGGQGRGIRGKKGRALTCLLNPSFKRSSGSGLLPGQGMERALCMAIRVGRAAQDSYPHHPWWHISAQRCLCLENTQLVLFLLPQTPCEWDRDTHWAWEKTPTPRPLLALLLLLRKGRTAGDRWMGRCQGVTETCSTALISALSSPFSVGVRGGLLGLLVA